MNSWIQPQVLKTYAMNTIQRQYCWPEWKIINCWFRVPGNPKETTMTIVLQGWTKAKFMQQKEKSDRSSLTSWNWTYILTTWRIIYFLTHEFRNVWQKHLHSGSGAGQNEQQQIRPIVHWKRRDPNFVHRSGFEASLWNNITCVWKQGKILNPPHTNKKEPVRKWFSSNDNN